MEAYSKVKVDELAALKHTAIAMYILKRTWTCSHLFSHCDSVLKFYRMEIEEFLFYCYGSAKLIWQNSTYQPKYQSQTGFVDHIREKTLLGAHIALPKKCQLHTWCWILNDCKPLSLVFLTLSASKHRGMLLFLILIMGYKMTNA